MKLRKRSALSPFVAQAIFGVLHHAPRGGGLFGFQREAPGMHDHVRLLPVVHDERAHELEQLEEVMSHQLAEALRDRITPEEARAELVRLEERDRA